MIASLRSQEHPLASTGEQLRVLNNPLARHKPFDDWGDATLFQRVDMTEASWSVVQPVLDVWKALPPRDFPNYAAGSWGPRNAQQLLRRDGREWTKCRT